MAAKSMEDIAGLLSKVKFKRRVFGGVDEADVWRIIDKLQKEYRSADDEQRIRSDALLRDRDETIARLQRALRERLG